ncbi:MAG: hypothetical protein WAK57_16185 [Desulfobacterales bacterium]|jgi:hypothetical protein
MKTSFGLLLGMGLFMAGCSSHYYKVEGPMVSVYLKKPDAGNAQFACSLDDYQPREVREVDGHWVITLPGGSAFRYFYIVDGAAFIPPCRLKEKDDFGSENCIFEPGL